MKLRILVVSLTATLAGMFALSTAPAQATETNANPCKIEGFYANPDEQDRLPDFGMGGATFKGKDLIHHAASLDVKDLKPGSFVASPAPDQESFFSVEVYGTDGGYATLRWNTTTNKWDMTTGGQFYSDEDPAVLVDKVTPHKSHKVISFGVGYTANPAGTVDTTVSSITFLGTKYALDCKPEPTKTVTATPTTKAPQPTKTATVQPTYETPPPIGGDVPGAGPSLPVTGTNVWVLVVAGMSLAAGGAALLLLISRTSRRKNKFVS